MRLMGGWWLWAPGKSLVSTEDLVILNRALSNQNHLISASLAPWEVVFNNFLLGLYLILQFAKQMIIYTSGLFNRQANVIGGIINFTTEKNVLVEMKMFFGSTLKIGKKFFTQLFTEIKALFLWCMTLIGLNVKMQLSCNVYLQISMSI